MSEVMERLAKRWEAEMELEDYDPQNCKVDARWWMRAIADEMEREADEAVVRTMESRTLDHSMDIFAAAAAWLCTQASTDSARTGSIHSSFSTSPHEVEKDDA